MVPIIFLCWVAVEPSPQPRRVVSKAVIQQSRLVIRVLRGEPERVGRCQTAVADRGVAVRAPLVMGEAGAARVGQIADVSIAIVEIEGLSAVQTGAQDAANRAGPLHAS